MFKKVRLFFVLCLFLSVSLFGNTNESESPKNIILFIGDGMGFNYVSAKLLTQKENAFRKFQSVGIVITVSADKLVTDSANGATVFATGYRVNNGAISITPEGKKLTTLFDYLKNEFGIATGLVATSSVTHATPAAFSANVENRRMENEIAKQFTERNLDVVIGGGRHFFLPESMEGKREDGLNLVKNIKDENYTYIETIEELKEYDGKNKLYALLEMNALPKAAERDYSLAHLTDAALKHLSQNENGFILMVEGSQIDWAGHDNDQENILQEMQDFLEAIETALNFAQKNGKTLVVVTADHETGGMTITGGSLEDNTLKMSFSSTGHTAASVPLFAKGPGEYHFRGVFDNYQVGRILFRLYNPDYKFD